MAPQTSDRPPTHGWTGTMLGAIVRKEFLERLISFRFFLGAALCVVLLPGVTYVRAREYATRAETHPKTVDSHRRDVARYPREFNWAHFGRVLDRPMNPLSILVEPADLRDGGQVDLMWREMPGYVPVGIGNPVPGLFPAFNVFTFVTVVMSLLAIVFSFDAICGEKERGTLKLTLATAVSRGAVLAGKWLGGLAALVLPFLVGSLLSALVILLTLSGHLTPGHWLAMGCALVISVIFLAMVYAAGMVVSSLAHHSATSAATLLLVWSVSFLVFPSLVPVVSSWISPTPSRWAYDEDVGEQVGIAWQQAQDKFDQYLNEHPNIREEDPNTFWVYQRQRYVDEMDLFSPVVEQLNEKYLRSLDAQVETASSLLRATPVGNFALAAHELTGAGASERARLLRAVARYRTRFFHYFSRRSVALMEERRQKNVRDLPPYTPGDFPLFEYRESSVSERLSRSLLDVALLVAWNAVLFVGAYARFTRYDVS